MSLRSGLADVARAVTIRSGLADAARAVTVRAGLANAAGWAAMVALLVLAGCAPEAEPIRYGHDGCEHCMMTISDQRYGAELVTTKGKVYTFDSVECLAGYVAQGTVAPEDVHALLVTDFKHPEALIPVEEAFFLHSSTLRSPMGMNLTAFGAGIRQEAVLDSFGGDVLDWDGVLRVVRDRGGHAAMR